MAMGGDFRLLLSLDIVRVMSGTRARNPILRALYFVLGLFFLALVPLSVLPFIPTFDLLALAAFFFAMSNERLYQWIVNHPRFGGPIRDFRAGLGFTRRMKGVGVGAVALSFALTIALAVDHLAVQLLMAALAIGIMSFIVTRPTKMHGVSSPMVGDANNREGALESV